MKTFALLFVVVAALTVTPICYTEKTHASASSTSVATVAAVPPCFALPPGYADGPCEHESYECGTEVFLHYHWVDAEGNVSTGVITGDRPNPQNRLLIKTGQDWSVVLLER